MQVEGRATAKLEEFSMVKREKKKSELLKCSEGWGRLA